MKKSKANASKIFTYVFLIIAAFISLFPFYFMFVSATNTNADILSATPKLFFGTNLLANLANLNKRLDLGRILLNSCILTFTYTGLAMLLHSMSGYAFAKYEFKGKNLIFGIITVSYTHLDVYKRQGCGSKGRRITGRSFKSVKE